MTRWAGLWFGERLKVSAACHHKIILRPQQAADFHLFTPEDSIHLFIHLYMAFCFILLLFFLQPTLSPMMKVHCPCRCDRRSDTLTGQLRPFRQDYSARPLLHPFFTAQLSASSWQYSDPAGHTSDLQINLPELTTSSSPDPHTARVHTGGHLPPLHNRRTPIVRLLLWLWR